METNLSSNERLKRAWQWVADMRQQYPNGPESTVNRVILALAEEVERLTLEFRLSSQQAAQLRDERDRLRKVAASPVETSPKPARDAEHCDFPDCEQHWLLVAQNLRATLQKIADCSESFRPAALKAIAESHLPPLEPEERQCELGSDDAEFGMSEHCTPVKASGECQHDLLKPGTTIEVIDKWKAKCTICIEFFDLPGRPENAGARSLTEPERDAMNRAADKCQTVLDEGLLGENGKGDV